MNALAFAAKRLVRPALRSIAFCFSVFLISTMTMVKSAHASGTVTTAPLWCSHEYNPASCIYSTKEEACYAAAADNPMYQYNPFVQYSGGWFVGYSCYGHPAAYPNDHYWAQSLGWLVTKASCPLNSQPTGSTTCTCNNNYVPDSTATSCVSANNCPANMSGSPCACNAGFVLNPYGPGCVVEQFTLSDPQNQSAP